MIGVIKGDTRSVDKGSIFLQKECISAAQEILVGRKGASVLKMFPEGSRKESIKQTVHNVCME